MPGLQRAGGNAVCPRKDLSCGRGEFTHRKSTPRAEMLTSLAPTVREPIARQRIGYLPEFTYYYRFLSAEELNGGLTRF
jgi:hypothetical protein